MKQIKYAVALILLSIIEIDMVSAKKRSIEFTPRIGFSIGNSDISNELGLNLGGQLSVPIVHAFLLILVCHLFV